MQFRLPKPGGVATAILPLPPEIIRDETFTEHGFQARGGARMEPRMKLHCEQYFTAEIAKIAEKIIRQLNS